MGNIKIDKTSYLLLLRTVPSGLLNIHSVIDFEAGPETVIDRIEAETELNPEAKDLIQRDIGWPNKTAPWKAEDSAWEIVINNREQHPELLFVSGW